MLIAFLLPVAATLTYGILLLIRRKDPLREPGTASAAAVDVVISCGVHFMIALHVVMLAGVLTRSPVAGRSLVLLLVGLALVVIGNVLPRTRPNLVVGIRTEQMLSNRALWIRTHRRLGYMAVGSGLLIMLSLLAACSAD